MPRYYFHIIENTTDRIDVDTEGVELPDARSAHVEALRAIGDMLRDPVGQPGEQGLDKTFLVLDETGARVTLVPFSLALKQ
jgi:hypothetical protein